MPTVKNICSIYITMAVLTPEGLQMELQEFENLFYIMVCMLYNIIIPINFTIPKGLTHGLGQTFEIF